MRSRILVVCGAFAMVLSTAAAARADGFVNPFIGAAFGGHADQSHTTFGGSVGAVGNAVGFEVDFGLTPNFFGPSADFGDNNVTTLMINVMFTGGSTMRPYLSTGLGVLKERVDGVGGVLDISRNDFGFNVGLGAMGFFSEHAGLRGDLRYFRGFKKDDQGDFDFDLEGFSFWRATLGAVFRF